MSFFFQEFKPLTPTNPIEEKPRKELRPLLDYAKSTNGSPPYSRLLRRDDYQWFKLAGAIIITGAMVFLWYIDIVELFQVFVPPVVIAYTMYTQTIPFDYKTAVIVVTGGGSGLGAEVARKLASKGAKVAVLTKSAPEYRNISGITSFICDVTDREAVRTVAKKLRKDVGTPNVIINNAGIVQGKLILDLTEEDVLNTFKVNAIAPFYVVQEFLPDMLKARRGHIMNISSLMGLLGVAQMADYCASKAAMVSFHESLRHELDYRYESPLIRTTLALPGHFNSALFGKVRLPKSHLWLINLLTPTLSVVNVADAIVDGLNGTRLHKTLRIPLFTQVARFLTPFADFVPGPIQRLSTWLTGADWGMREYGPQPDAGERLAAVRLEETNAENAAKAAAKAAKAAADGKKKQ